MKVQAIPVDKTNIRDAPKFPEGKQGILEIPKQAATIIRNFIDRNLQSYLNLTTPAPDPRKPDSLTNSIVGHYLLGNWYGTVVPAPAYNPEKHQGTVKPLYISNEASYVGHSEFVPAPSTAEPSPVVSKVDEGPSGTTQRSRPRRTRPSEKPPHVLDTDTSLNGIYNSFGAQLNTAEPPTAVPSVVTALPPDVTATGIYNPFGVELNTIDNTDEVYWIDPTRPSVLFPIEASTQRRRITSEATPGDSQEVTTDSGLVSTTTDDDDDEETRRKKRF